MLKYYIN